MTSAGLLNKESALAFARGLVVQAEVVHAIILRETRTRFGKTRFGYLWALADPMLVILTFWGFAVAIDRAAPPGMDAFSFLATGIVPFRLFASSAQQVGESINGNRALLFYPRVIPFDLVIARAIFEVITYATVFVILMGCHTLYTQRIEVFSPLHVLGGFALMSLLGSAVGLVFCALSVLWASVDRARGALLRPLFWVSGIFFTVAQLPERAQGLALYNPIIHAVEMVRAGWFPTHSPEYIDTTYVLRCILGVGLVGLILERAVRKRIQLT